MDPYIGKMLDERYEILDVLGTGGMAVVYRAYDHRLNRYVAVKILKGELATDQDLRRRFHDESQSVAMLSHPNIVSIYDVNQVEGREFIVMELIDGITLKQYMKKRGGCLNWREALHFISQIMQALKHAHSRGIIHRDIKPQNVMVLRDGSVKVMDFGIARSTTSQATVTQEAIGSVHYISPEQARGSHIDARSDIYSAGVVLYEMLTGRLPFEGDNPVSVAIQHINSIPVAPRELNPDIPIGMEQITMKAMASVPDRRYANAEAMLEDLEAFRKNPSIDFGYSAPGVVEPAADEPTVIRKGGSFVAPVDEDDQDATVYRAPTRRPTARFEREEPEEDEPEYDEDDDEYEDSARSGKRTKVIIGVGAGVVVVLAVVLVVLLRSLFGGSSAKEYQVPDLTGKTVQEAQDYIDNDATLKGHFTVKESETTKASDLPEGTIVEQTPDSTRTVKAESTTITVTLSSGPDASTQEQTEFTMSDYTDQDYRKVMTELQNLNMKLVVKCEQEFSDTVTEGNIIRTDPSSGATVKQGATVTLYYSKGAENTDREMINVIGLTEKDAKNALSNLNLGLRVNVDSEYNDAEEGTIFYQSIPEKGTVKKGDTINLKVSLGKDPNASDNTTSETQKMVNLLGLKEADAKSVIARLGLNATYTSDYSSSYDEGDVCYQSIPQDTPVTEGESIQITISLGEKPSSGGNTDTGNTDNTEG